MDKYIKIDTLIDYIDWDNDIEKWTLRKEPEEIPSADIVTEIFDKIDELLTKHAVMVSFQDGGSRLLFSRTLEIDLAELKNNLLGDI